MEAELVMSPPLCGGPRGGNCGCCSVGVTAFDVEFELLPERRPEEDELEPELSDLFVYTPVCDRFTIRLDEAVLEFSMAVALVKVSVKYGMSSMLQTEMIQHACTACLYADAFSNFCAKGTDSRASGAMTTSTATS